MSKPIPKIPFTILINENVKKEIEQLYPDSYERSFSRWIESLLVLGMQEYKFQDKGEGFK